jgi:Domain of unknown function (DUF4234)
MNPDPLHNPYAPPAYDAATNAAAEATDYRDERRSVLLLVLLCVVTLGIYPPIWYLRRRRFLDSLAADVRLGALPWALLVTNAVVVGVLLAKVPEGPKQLARIASTITGLIVAFRAAHILRSDCARTGRQLSYSGAGVFFFGCLYLQHLINEAADAPARTRPLSLE